MQIVLHKLDWYTKLVLTVIAAALIAMLLKPFFTSREVGATAEIQRQIIDVNLNIDQVGGEKILRWWERERAEKGIPIYIEGKITTE
ncbi:hypothetical protein IBX65_05980 [Candidatus Aerophobetes bacterium]|nr:hypothetical protein [Candidatus Aerophobetes bacterium]